MSRPARAARRTAFNADRLPPVDAAALSNAVARVLDELGRLDDGAGDGDGGPRPLDFPGASDVRRWVPIGPSVVKGSASSQGRVSGRVRDIAVSDDGRRVYAATAKGGVWYSGDGAATWSPVGGWGPALRNRGGDTSALSTSALLVSFGAADDGSGDTVLVGTGEVGPFLSTTSGRRGGVGILAGRGPVTRRVDENVWEAGTGIATLEGRGTFRLARDPHRTPFDATATQEDRVAAATSDGLFIGTRQAAGQYDWVRSAALDARIGGAFPITDVLWLDRGGGQSRLLATVRSGGVLFSDDAGATWDPVPNTFGVGVQGRLSMALVPGTNRVYVLAELTGPPVTVALWQVADATAGAADAAFAPTAVAGVPAAGDLWGTGNASQRDYDQAIAVIEVDHGAPVGVQDRVHLGGSTIQPTGPGDDWTASLWAFDVQTGPLRLTPAVGLARTGRPNASPSTAGDGADRAGLVGNDVHADVHRIVVAGPAAARQLWVACDGGVYSSAAAGRVNTFSPRVVGLAALEPTFLAPHPTSSHFLAAGMQDNGSQVRAGESVWEVISGGDGGGQVIHPIRSEYVISQYVDAYWSSVPTSRYRDPMTRQRGWPNTNRTSFNRENGASQFYSGAAVIRDGARARIAIGTNRVWLSDTIGQTGAQSWVVLGWPSHRSDSSGTITVGSRGGVAVDARTGGRDRTGDQLRGVPPAGTGNVPAAGAGEVVTLKWSSTTSLLALFQRAVVRYDEAPAGTWTPTVIAFGPGNGPDPATTAVTDIAPVAGTGDFYLTTLGEFLPAVGAAAPARQETCWFFDAAAGAWVDTALRERLDETGPPLVPGPLDPAYAVAVDPSDGTFVYVGTVTGVWQGERRPLPDGDHLWTPVVNGLPAAAAQDLSIWSDPSGAADAPRLLRAAVQSRGVWEVDLAAAEEPRRTYVRVHAQDDRRRLPTPMANPRLRTTAPARPAFASPDIAVRPRWPVMTAPTWRFGAAGRIRRGTTPNYQLWTFQTAFRWHAPSTATEGVWSEELADALDHHRLATGLPRGRFIDRDLWNAVVGDTRLGADGEVTTDGSGELAVYRAPWQSPLALDAAATEVDLVESVVPVRETNDEWTVFREPSTVDVVLHHRDTRRVPARSAFALLVWRSGRSIAELMGADPTPLVAWATSHGAGVPIAVPAGWQAVADDGGALLHQLPVPLDARLPRAVSIDVDLGDPALATERRVLLLAFVGSTVDPFSAPVGGPTSTVSDLVRSWSHAAARVVRLRDRP